MKSPFNSLCGGGVPFSPFSHPPLVCPYRHWSLHSGGVPMSGLELCQFAVKERKKTDNPREGWEDGTPPHRDFKERSVVLAVAHPLGRLPLPISYLSLDFAVSLQFAATFHAASRSSHSRRSLSCRFIL